MLTKGIIKYLWRRWDQDKVSFITSEGIFCYIVMPFKLKNLGATYYHLMDNIFN